MEEHKDNLMLFHGTTDTSSRGILETGFRVSKKENGYFGAGFYMTECSDVALLYSNQPNSNKKTSETCCMSFYVKFSILKKCKQSLSPNTNHRVIPSNMRLQDTPMSTVQNQQRMTSFMMKKGGVTDTLPLVTTVWTTNLWFKMRAL